MFFPVALAPGAMGLCEISFILFFFNDSRGKLELVLFVFSCVPLQAQRQEHGILMKAEIFR